jgi:hypothetical protein
MITLIRLTRQEAGSTVNAKATRTEMNVYSYEVAMVVQILAQDEQSARSRLDSEGGQITYRAVTLRDSVAVYCGPEVPDDDEE